MPGKAEESARPDEHDSLAADQSQARDSCLLSYLPAKRLTTLNCSRLPWAGARYGAHGFSAAGTACR